MVRLTARKVGHSLGVTIPARAARALHVREGDALYPTQAPDGFRLTPDDPDFEKSMEIAEGSMKRYENALRDLAKRSGSRSGFPDRSSSPSTRHSSLRTAD